MLGSIKFILFSPSTIYNLDNLYICVRYIWHHEECGNHDILQNDMIKKDLCCPLIVIHENSHFVCNYYNDIDGAI